MRKLHFLSALLITGLVLAVSIDTHSQIRLTPAHAAVDATAAWNSVCANYGFPEAPVGGGSFADNWPTHPMPGTTCQTQLDAACAAVAHLMGTPEPGYGEGDLMNDSVENWPDS